MTSRHEGVSTARSSRSTASGAVTITALVPMPSAHAPTAATYQPTGRGEPTPRTNRYSVSR